MVEVANCNQRLSHPLTPPFRKTTVGDTGLRCRRLRPQRAMRFLYKGKLRNYIYLIIQKTDVIANITVSCSSSCDETRSAEQFVRLGLLMQR